MRGMSLLVAAGVVLLVACFSAIALAGSRVPRLTSTTHVEGIVVEGRASDRQDWVGCTIDSNANSEFDIDDFNAPAIQVASDFKVSFNTVTMNRSDLVGRPYVVALWDDRVENCGCEYCERFGYHLVGRLAVHSGVVPKSAYDW